MSKILKKLVILSIIISLAISFNFFDKEVANANYVSSGNYISQVFGEDQIVSFDKLVVSGEDIPTGTSIGYEYASLSNNYSSWTKIDFNKIPFLTGEKYIKIKITLATSNTNVTPSLTGFDLYYSINDANPVQKSVNLSFDLQGKTNNKSTVVKVKVINSDNNTIIQDSSITTDSNGKAVYTISSSATKLKIYAKPASYLSKSISIDLNSSTDANFGQIFAGNLQDSDDTINSLDFSLINKFWKKSDPTADINQDGTVNSLDFSFLNMNWKKQGEAVKDNISF